ncbi:hypothetical protein CYCD_29370 [Tenuifilaceae bacterium CYCD]|nr:hypothetical protein CYCD_29370 [Tenuifilaceae bacterium CYCD]
MQLTIKGKNLESIKVYFSNSYTKNTPLYIFKAYKNSISYTIPDYAYVQSIQLTLENRNDYTIEKIEFTGNNHTVSIKKNDFNYFLKVSNREFNPKKEKFEWVDSSKISNAPLIINSINVFDYLKEISIKRIPTAKNILYSIILTIFILGLYYLLFVIFKQKLSLKISIALFFVPLLALTIFFSTYTKPIDKNLFEEKGIFEVIKPHTPNNLIYNGDFKHELLFWGYDSDSTTQELVDTPYGKGIKITRANGNGSSWSLRYYGRPIIYHKDHTYQIKFKYKVIKGTNIPFYIGWWIRKNENEYLNAISLKIHTDPIEENWYNAEVHYTFLYNHKNLVCLLHSLKDYSEIYITDVQIYDITRNINQIDFIDTEGIGIFP